MSVLQTVLVFWVVPLGLFLLIVLATQLGQRRRRRYRYRPGRSWPYPPLLWTADAQGAGLPPLDDAPADPQIAALTGGSETTGGARGSW